MQKIERVLCTRRVALLGIAGVLAEMAGCGGGGTDVAGLSSGGTGSFTSGTITGFGSIIVNGIRYKDDTASVFSDDGTAITSLQLGMVVNIEGSAVTPAASATSLPTATAYRITYGSEWIGPVSNIVPSVAATGVGTFEVLGHTVDVLSTTLFGGVVQKYLDLKTDQYVEVYGYVDPSDGHIQASRIEVFAVQPSAYKLSGTISQIDAINRSATLGQISINWASPTVLPSGINGGDFVRVTLNPNPLGTVWTATKIHYLSSPLSNLSGSQDYEAEVYGSITSYQSTASFLVNGIPVNATSASISGALMAGVFVEVEGRIRSGQLMATKVEVKSSSEIESQDFEFYGYITNLNSNAKTFELRGETFSYDSNTKNLNLLTSANLVEVKASRSNGLWYAREIEIEG